MISKKQFVKVIEFILEQDKRERKLQEALQSYTGDKDFTGWHTCLQERVVHWLEAEMDDSDETISWWLWDAPESGKKPEHCTITWPTRGKEWELLTPADLYDYLVENESIKTHHSHGARTYSGSEVQAEAVKFCLNEIDKLAESNDTNNLSNAKYYEYNALFKLIRGRIENGYRMESGDFDTNFCPDDCLDYLLFRRENDER